MPVAAYSDCRRFWISMRSATQSLLKRCNGRISFARCFYFSCLIRTYVERRGAAACVLSTGKEFAANRGPAFRAAL